MIQIIKYYNWNFFVIIKLFAKNFCELIIYYTFPTVLN